MIEGYDSTDINLIPADTQAVVCYWDGDFANYGAAVARFPALHALGRILPLSGAHGFSDPKAPGTDIEPGNAGPETVVPFVRFNTNHRPVIYADETDMITCVANLHAAGIVLGQPGPSRPVRILVAHPTGTPHICGPSTCGFPIEADATQWEFNPGGLNVDRDLFRDDFFSLPGPGPHPIKEGDMIAVHNLHDGRLAVFVEKADTGEVFHTWQAQEGGWAGSEAGKRNAGWLSLGIPDKERM